MKSFTLFSRDRITHLLVAVLVGTFFVPVTQMAVPGLREQASAMTEGALLNLDASNASSYSGSGVNWYDISGNSRHATLVNSPTYDATNKAISWGNTPRNNSLNTNGKYATVSNFYTGSWTGFSISFYADMGSADKDWSRVLDFSPNADTNGSANNINVAREWTTNNLNLNFTGSSTSVYGGCKADIISNNAFAHYAITVDGSGNCKFYKNGTLTNTVTITGSSTPVRLPTTTARGSAYIARSHWQDAYSDGKLRNLAIYNATLTAEQVTVNYNAQIGPSISYSPVGVTPSGSVSATPVTSGGSITTFSVSASTPLPSTLAINSTTGVITGTAPSSSGSFTYTINAISGGSTSVTTNFVLTVGLENSICFNGTDQYLSLTSNTNLPLSNNAYTIEAFIKSSTSNIGGIAAWGNYGSGFQSNAFAFGNNPNGYRNYHWGGDLNVASRNGIITNGSWHHVVAQYDGSTKRIYENGYLVGTNTATLNVSGTTNFTIGKAYGSEYLNGCISNLRIVKGVAVYGGTSTTAANFTVPTTFLTSTQASSTNISAITGTQTVLLMNNQSNILQDASSFGYTLTKNGTPTISSSGPSLTSGALTAQTALTLNSTSGTYGTPLRLTTTGGTGTGAVSYSTSTSGCNITNTDSLTVTSAVTCSVTATKAADATYSAISSSATNVVFATRPITIKAAAKSATYTGSRVSVSNSYSITSGSLAGSDTFTALTYTYSSGSYSASQLAPINAGSYTITPSAASFSVGSASNYSITYETAALTIGVAAQAALTLTSTAGTYGTPLRLTTTGGSGTGAVTYVTGSAGCSITNTDSLTVNSALTCSVTATKAADSNFTAISSSATNVVFAVRPITIKAAAKSATYTGSSVSVSNSYSITSGTLAGSDTFTALTYTYSSGSYSASQTAPINAGSYTITPSAAAFSVGLASNYSITYETATLTIAKANQSALTITTTTSTYGTPLRLITSGGSGTGALSFAVTGSGTASGCAISSETITAGSFGTCRVTATKATDNNYLVVSSIETVITFSKAETITVTTTLSSYSVMYNELPANVTVTQTVTGLVNSDTPTVTATYTLQSCQSGGACAIGDIAPGGGYVFHVSATPINIATGVSTGGIYLATAPQTWYGGATDPTASWGCSGTDISGTSEAVGSGAQNTWLNTVGCATAGRASRLAADSSAEGFTDWFMPSIGELNLMYSNLKLSNLSNLDGSFYWSSTQNASNSASSATYMAFNGSGVATADKTSVFSVRPIRAFSPTAVAINTLPTDVGTYAVAPTLTLSSPASLSNYQAVEYVGTTLTINKARQRALTVGQYDAYPGISTYPLNIYGGSGPGILTRTLVSGGSAGCSMVQDLFITAASVGTCDVRVEKAGTGNYFAESTTATIYWMTFVNRYIPSVPATPTDFGLSGSVAIEKRSYETFTVSSFANGSGSAVTSVAMNSVMRIIGMGFNSSDETTEVIIGFSSIPKSSLTFNTSNPAANYVQFTVPNDLDLGANDVAMKSRKGWAFASGVLTVTE
jgi:hypothetical protein